MPTFGVEGDAIGITSGALIVEGPPVTARCEGDRIGVDALCIEAEEAAGTESLTKGIACKLSNSSGGS